MYVYTHTVDHCLRLKEDWCLKIQLILVDTVDYIEAVEGCWAAAAPLVEREVNVNRTSEDHLYFLAYGVN